MSLSPYSAAMRRPAFDARGKVVARRHVNLSRVYEPGEEIPASEQVPERTLRQLWEQASIDTLPADPAAPSAPAQPAPKPAQPQHPNKNHQQRR